MMRAIQVNYGKKTDYGYSIAGINECIVIERYNKMLKASYELQWALFKYHNIAHYT